MNGRERYRQLALNRLAEAEYLHAGGHWAAAYHFAGLAAELGIKACILARSDLDIIFDDPEYSRKCRTHEIEKLIHCAGLAGQLDAARDPTKGGNPNFAANWRIVVAWRIESRYDSNIVKTDSSVLLKALTDPVNGVFAWLKLYW
jgi:hypothetical protein